MPISTYPRPGTRLAPATLRDILNVPLSKNLQGQRYATLSDLDEHTWTHFARSTCEEMGRRVILEVARRSHSLPSSMRQMHLPELPHWIRLEDLELEKRTFNAVSRFLRHTKAPVQDLHKLTIGDVLKLKGLGAKCLVDLLVALEALQPEDLQFSQFPLDQRTQSAKLTRECQRLMRISAEIAIDDPRLRRFIMPLVSTIHHSKAQDKQPSSVRDCISMLATCRTLNVAPEKLGKQIRRIRTEIYKLRREMLERELLEILVNASDERTTGMLVRYLGWDGGVPGTLQEVGDKHGLTRERVRQICENPLQTLRKKKVFTPALDRALRLVSKNAPRDAANIEQMLALKRVSARPFRIEGLLTAADVFGKNVDFRLDPAKTGRIVAPLTVESFVAITDRIARRAIEHWGAATIESILNEVRTETGSLLGPEIITDVLQLRSDLSWLDQNTGWFWLTSVPRNRIRYRNDAVTASLLDFAVQSSNAGIVGGTYRQLWPQGPTAAVADL
jgi:Sigma-70, region 4